MKPRARDVAGLELRGTPGALNAITDVTGVRVGHTTLIEGDGPPSWDVAQVRTGVTVMSRTTAGSGKRLFAGCPLNGNGELTGLEWVRESGTLTSPIALTNTHSVGVVRDALVAAQVHERDPRDLFWSTPVVGETWDGILNDVNGQHVTAEHLRAALESASADAVEEGSVGGGTGMICHGFKGASAPPRGSSRPGRAGTSSASSCRRNTPPQPARRRRCVRVGEALSARSSAACHAGRGCGSIIIVVATEAPSPDPARPARATADARHRAPRRGREHFSGISSSPSDGIAAFPAATTGARAAHGRRVHARERVHTDSSTRWRTPRGGGAERLARGRVDDGARPITANALEVDTLERVLGHVHDRTGFGSASLRGRFAAWSRSASAPRSSATTGSGSGTPGALPRAVGDDRCRREATQKVRVGSWSRTALAAPRRHRLGGGDGGRAPPGVRTSASARAERACAPRYATARLATLEAYCTLSANCFATVYGDRRTTRASPGRASAGFHRDERPCSKSLGSPDESPTAS